jgi:hypothetical protein
VEKDGGLNGEPQNEKDNRDGNHRLGGGFTPIGAGRRNHPRSRELALLDTFEVIVAPTAIASAINAAAMTTVVALTSPRSKSISREAVNLTQ